MATVWVPAWVPVQVVEKEKTPWGGIACCCILLLIAGSMSKCDGRRFEPNDAASSVPIAVVPVAASSPSPIGLPHP